jgi:hypothetical protein
VTGRKGCVWSEEDDENVWGVDHDVYERLLPHRSVKGKEGRKEK